VANNQSVSFRSAEGEDFVRDVVECVGQFLLTATVVAKFGEHGQGPAA
jgi:hypothetical protein